MIRAVLPQGIELMARDSGYVAVYDVSNDRERGRVADVLEGFGLRVQFSAFELRLSPATRRTLLRRLEELKLQTGFLYLYRRAGNQDRTAVGAAPVDTLAETNHAWVVAEPTPRPRAPRRSTRARKVPAPATPPANPAHPWAHPVLPEGFPGAPASEAVATHCQAMAAAQTQESA